MKILRTIVFAALTAVVAFAACSKRISPVDSIERLDTITATISETQTKVTGRDSTEITPLWEKGDIVYGYYGSDASQTVKYSVSAVADPATSATLTWAGEGQAPAANAVEGKTFHVIYDGTNPSPVPASVPYQVDFSTQDGTLDGALNKAVMAASGTVSNKSLTLNFSNLMSVIKIQKPSGKTITGISACAGISGNATVSFNGNNAALAKGGESKITIGGGYTGDYTYAVVPSGTIIGMTFWALDTQNLTYAADVYSTTESPSGRYEKAVAPSKFYTFENPSFEHRAYNTLRGLFHFTDETFYSGRINFAKGNLQKNTSTDNKWRLAEHQYDPAPDGWTDQLNWDSYKTSSIQVEGCNADLITPSEPMMRQIINRECGKGFATVNGIKGVVLLPDDWIDPGKNTGNSQPAFDCTATNFSANVYSAEDWPYMEAAGCVFLPAAWEEYCSYWTSTEATNNDAYYVRIGPNTCEFYPVPKTSSCSVRLVYSYLVSQQ